MAPIVPPGPPVRPAAGETMGRVSSLALDPRTAARLKRDAAGLVCAVVQQHDTREVLMVAWMNDDALAQTLATGRATYFAQPRAAVAQGRHVRARPVGAQGLPGLRRRRAPARGGAGRRGLPHRRPDLLRRHHPPAHRPERVSAPAPGAGAAVARADPCCCSPPSAQSSPSGRARRPGSAAAPPPRPGPPPSSPPAATPPPSPRRSPSSASPRSSPPRWAAGPRGSSPRSSSSPGAPVSSPPARAPARTGRGAHRPGPRGQRDDAGPRGGAVDVAPWPVVSAVGGGLVASAGVGLVVGARRRDVPRAAGRYDRDARSGAGAAARRGTTRRPRGTRSRTATTPPADPPAHRPGAPVRESVRCP